MSCATTSSLEVSIARMNQQKPMKSLYSPAFMPAIHAVVWEESIARLNAIIVACRAARPMDLYFLCWTKTSDPPDTASKDLEFGYLPDFSSPCPLPFCSITLHGKFVQYS